MPGFETMDRCGASTLVIWAWAVLAMARCVQQSGVRPALVMGVA
jgi:hypothetical protein